MPDPTPPARTRGFGPRPADTIAARAEDGLGGLWRRARWLQRLTTLVRAVLPPELAPHIGVAGLRDGELTLLASTAAWATRARFARIDLMEGLGQLPEFHGLHDIRVKVAGDGGLEPR